MEQSNGKRSPAGRHENIALQVEINKLFTSKKNKLKPLVSCKTERLPDAISIVDMINAFGKDQLPYPATRRQVDRKLAEMGYGLKALRGQRTIFPRKKDHSISPRMAASVQYVMINLEVVKKSNSKYWMLLLKTNAVPVVMYPFVFSTGDQKIAYVRRAVDDLVKQLDKTLPVNQRLIKDRCFYILAPSDICAKLITDTWPGKELRVELHPLRQIFLR